MNELVQQLQLRKDITVLERDPKPRSWNVEADILITAKPEQYLQVFEYLASGDSLDKVSRATGVSKKALRAIRDRHPEAIEGQASAIARNMAEGLHLTSERIIEDIDKISPNKLMFALDVQTKNLALLTGHPTSRHEQNINVASPEDLDKLFQQLPDAK